MMVSKNSSRTGLRLLQLAYLVDRQHANIYLVESGGFRPTVKISQDRYIYIYITA